ncbi:methyl-accepting chemotaxis protein [Vibrio sp. PP-XX7]
MRVGALAANIPTLTVGFANGDAFASFSNNVWVNGKKPATYDPRKRPWYQQAIQTSNPIFTDLYKDATTGEPMVSIGKNAQNGTVILADIPLTVLNETLKRIDIHGADSLIMANDSTVLASSSSEMKDGDKLTDSLNLAQIARNVTSADHLISDYKSDGVEKVMFSQKIKYGDKNWFLMVSLNKEIVFSQLESMRLHAFLFTLLYVVMGIIVTLFVLNLLYRPILALKTTVIDLSQGNGDLTQRLDVKTNDDLGQIATGINKFIENLQQLMLEIESSTLALKSNIAKLKHQSEDNALILSHHVQETEQIVTAIEEMSATADSVAQNAGEAAQFTREASNIGQEALQIVSNAQSRVSTLVDEVGRTSDSLHAMSEETKQISTVLNVIGDIAEQTNLLALNAAIEAARAGEQGRGFAVVADEVRALASRTQSSTEEVEQALTRLLSRNARVMEAMDGTKTTCQHAFESTDKVSHSINDLTAQVAEITDLSTQIATAAEEQSSVSLRLAGT